jgi:hypothetical protein
LIDMAAFWLGILGGMIAWFGTMLVGQPFYELTKLRRQVATLLHYYEPISSDDHRATILGWNDKRADAYRDCAANLLAFASTQAIVCRITRLLPLLGWKAREAAEQLWKLAPLGPGAADRPQLRREVAEAFKLKMDQ